MIFYVIGAQMVSDFGGLAGGRAGWVGLRAGGAGRQAGGAGGPGGAGGQGGPVARWGSATSRNWNSGLGAEDK